MKAQKLSLIFLVFLINCQIFFAYQKNENFTLFDSFSEATYEDLIARLDFLMVEKNKIPNAVAYVIIYGGSDQIENAFYQKAIFRYINKVRQFDEQKIKILTSAGAGKIKFEFWISKDGTKPEIEQKDFSLIVPTNGKVIKFADDSIEIVKIDEKQTYLTVGCEFGCIKSLDFYLLSEILQANSSLQAFVIIHNKNLKKAKFVKNILSEEVFNNTKISDDRIKFLYGGQNKTNDKRYSEIEVYLAIDQTQLPKSLYLSKKL